MLFNWEIDREVAITTPTVYLYFKVLKLILRMFFSVPSIKDGANKETVFPPFKPLENKFNESDELFVLGSGFFLQTIFDILMTFLTDFLKIMQEVLLT